MIFKTNHMFWDANESTGYRHVSVEYNDRVLMAVTSYKTLNVWQSKVIPMGFSFSIGEIEVFAKMFSVLPDLLKFMCADSITFEEMQEFLLTLQ